jgi:hypothetical protein
LPQARIPLGTGARVVERLRNALRGRSGPRALPDQPRTTPSAISEATSVSV